MKLTAINVTLERDGIHSGRWCVCGIASTEPASDGIAFSSLLDFEHTPDFLARCVMDAAREITDRFLAKSRAAQ